MVVWGIFFIMVNLFMSIDPKLFEDIAKKLGDSMPDGLKHLRNDMEENIRSIMQQTFNKMHL